MAAGEKGGSRAAEIYAAGLFLLYAILVLAHAGAPSLTDYANWSYQGLLLRDHLLGHPDAAYVLKRYPVPNSLTTIGIGLCSLLLPWLLAAKVWLVVQLGLCFACMRMLLRTVQAHAVVWVVVPQAVFLNVNFWYGFMNFELGLAWVMLFAAMLLRGAKPWALTLVLVLVFFTHMIPFCFCLVMLGLWAWQTGRWRTVWAAAPAVLLTFWYVAGRFLLAGNADGQAGMRETFRDYSAAFWLFKANSYAKSFGFVDPMGLVQTVAGRAGFAALLLAEAVLAMMVGWAVLRSVRMGWRARRDDRFVWFGVCLLLPIFLLAPGAALGISDPGARVLQTALALALVFCWGGLGKSLRVLAGFSAGVLAAGGLAMFLVYGGDVGSTLQAGPRTRIAEFARVPNDDQNYFYRALRDGRMDQRIFPTGMFLNR